TRFSYAAVKISKHGTTILHVPGKEVYFDLTIHMDVQANPGPATLPNSGRQTANFIHIPSTDNCPKLYYSRDQLMSFRPSCFSTKRLNPQLIRKLKYLNILKYRGKSGVLHLNIRSLRNISHRSQLRELNSREQSDIITISESWLNTTITSTEIQLDGYKLFRLDRLHKGGGGVCAYVRSELKQL
ncbi:unnamed protein product, partial [Porites evermanni]